MQKKLWPQYTDFWRITECNIIHFEKETFLWLFRNPKIYSKRTSFWSNLVRNYVTLVLSWIYLKVCIEYVQYLSWAMHEYCTSDMLMSLWVFPVN